MKNPYKIFLEGLFVILLEYKDTTSRVSKVLKDDAEIYSKDGGHYLSIAALIVSDWTGQTDDGWELNFHTGVTRLTNDYEVEIENLISRECCLMFSQSFEALEKFIKDCIYYKIQTNESYKRSLNLKEEAIERDKIKGGEELFKHFKKAGGNTYTKHSNENNKNIKFKELWVVLSEARHSITHSSAKIKKNKLNISKHHFDIFNYLFDSKTIDMEVLLIQLSYKRFEKLLKHLAEFAYQIFKILSIEESLPWELES